MNTSKTLLPLILAITLLTTGCSFEVVPPATKGKILSTSGYSGEILSPGKYTLWGRDQLITIDTKTSIVSEPVEVILADKLTLTADVRFRGRIGGTTKIVNHIFNDIAPTNGHVNYITVYNTYGKMLVRNIARAVLSSYTVEDVHKNYKRLSAEISGQIRDKFKNLPLEVSDIALGKIQYPPVITEAVNTAKARELAIKKEQAQAEIELTKKRNEKLLAKASHEIEMTKAATIRDSNKILSEGVTADLLALKRLEVLIELAKNQNAVFVPTEALSSPGLQVRLFNPPAQ